MASGRSYEALVIVKSTVTDAEIAQIVSQLEEPVKRFGGRIEQTTSWGRRRLAYRIGRQNEAYYHLIHFELSPEQLAEVKRTFQLNESILRFLILSRSTAQEPRPAQPAAAAAGESASATSYEGRSSAARVTASSQAGRQASR